jgi:hypothetical protein
MYWKGASNEMKRTGRPFRLGVLICCLLSFTASFDLAVLAPYFDPSTLVWSAETSIVETEEPLEDESGDMLRPMVTSNERREERKQPTASLPIAIWMETPSWLFPAGSCSIRLPCLKRAGCEHALRNGLGAPLLC